MDLVFLEKSESKWLTWLRGNVRTVMMFFKRSKLFHSSSEKLSFGRISVRWFLKSTYLIWILGSKLIRSKNKSRAILWVLDTCLMKGLLPFVIIFNIASLFWKIYNLESSSEECKLLDELFRFLSFNWTLYISLLLSEALIESFLLVWDDYSVFFYYNLKIKCKKFIRNPVSYDIISDSVELWDVEVYFLRILIYKNGSWTFK